MLKKLLAFLIVISLCSRISFSAEKAKIGYTPEEEKLNFYCSKESAIIQQLTADRKKSVLAKVLNLAYHENVDLNKRDSNNSIFIICFIRLFRDLGAKVAKELVNILEKQRTSISTKFRLLGATNPWSANAVDFVFGPLGELRRYLYDSILKEFSKVMKDKDIKSRYRFKLLISKLNDAISAKDIYRETPLREVTDKNGNNLAHLAALAGNEEAMGLVLSQEPYLINQLNNFMKRPIDLAIKYPDLLRKLNELAFAKDTSKKEKT